MVINNLILLNFSFNLLYQIIRISKIIAFIKWFILLKIFIKKNIYNNNLIIITHTEKNF